MDQETVREVLADPIAQQLLQSAIPARLAYDALDHTPRVVPVGFHWSGKEFVVGTMPKSAKVRAIAANPKVAMTVDTDDLPPRVLLVRGTATVTVVDGVPDAYIEGARKRMDPSEWEGFEQQVRSLYDQMAVITIVPEWAKVLDFETRIPSAVEDIVRAKMAQ